MIYGLPNGPWGFDATGTPANMFYSNAPYFTFGADPYAATVGNNASGTTSIPFVPLIFAEGPSLWADSMLSAGALSAGLRCDTGFYYC